MDLLMKKTVLLIISSFFFLTSSYAMPPKDEQKFNGAENTSKTVRCGEQDDDDGAEESGSTGIPVVEKALPSDTTIVTKYTGKSVVIKGNQLILWARKVIEYAITHNIDEASHTNRKAVVEKAITEKTATISSSNDWLILEGMFDAFPSRPGKIWKGTDRSNKFFEGILKINLNKDIYTTIEFKRNKICDVLLYAYIHDKELVSFIEKDLGIFLRDKGLSYWNLNQVCQAIKSKYHLNDQELATRQLKVLQLSIEYGDNDKFILIDKFLAYFNAILFGSESSRNRLSFATGLMVLDLISENKLSYEQAFASKIHKDKGNTVVQKYAVYPMASPYTGPGNFMAYIDLEKQTSQEKEQHLLQSAIGMKDSRSHPQKSQIQLKEALLLKAWFLPCCKEGELDTVSTSRYFQEHILHLLCKYFPILQKELLYSPDEFDQWSHWELSEEKWEDSDKKITIRDELKMTPSSLNPLTMEKIVSDAYYETASQIMEEVRNCCLEP